jgi:hypothetical protein
VTKEAEWEVQMKRFDELYGPMDIMVWVSFLEAFGESTRF